MAGRDPKQPTLETFLKLSGRADVDAWATVDALAKELAATGFNTADAARVAGVIPPGVVASVYRRHPTTNHLCASKWPAVQSADRVLSNHHEPVPVGETGKNTVDLTADDPDDNEKANGAVVVPSTGPCGRKRCQDNPNCLNWIGREKWASQSLESDFVRNRMAGSPLPWSEDLENEMQLDRDALMLGETRIAASSPPGLVNFGATCYLNALLQVWSADPLFLARVYEFAERIEPIRHLAIVFARMRHGLDPIVQPVEFIANLDLEKNVQQDTQEFAKLVLQLMDDKIPDFNSTNTIGGMAAFLTQCLNCKASSRSPFPFHDLVLPPRIGATVPDLIASVLAPERMDGDNQVYCSHCQSKQDTERRMVIEAVAPMVCLQIARFGFDIKTGANKKATAAIKVPHRLRVPGVDQELALAAIVFHKGRSVHYGHYTALVHDRSLGNDLPTTSGKAMSPWRLFDDAQVTRLPASDIRVRDPISTGEGYLLFYVHANRLDLSAPTAEPLALPPPSIMTVIEAENAVRTRARQETFEMYQLAVQAFEQLRDERYSAFDLLQPTSLVDRNACYLPTHLLRKVFDPARYIPLQPPTNRNTAATPTAVVTTNEDDLILDCVHGKLDPLSVRHVKRVHTRGVPALFELLRADDELVPESQQATQRQQACLLENNPFPSNDQAGECVQCIADRIVRYLSSAAQQEDYALLQSALRRNDLLLQTVAIRDVWCPALWLAACHRTKRLTTPSSFLSFMFCAHGELLPSSSTRTRVPTAVAELIEARFPDCLFPPATTKVCALCKEMSDAQDAANRQRIDQAEMEEAQLRVHLGYPPANPSSVGDWRSSFMDPLVADLDQAREADDISDDLYAVEAARIAERAGPWLPRGPVPESFVVVPAAFVCKWDAHVRDPVRCPRPDPPVDFGPQLLCQHGLLRADPRCPLDRSMHVFVTLSVQAWEQVLVFYPWPSEALAADTSLESPGLDPPAPAVPSLPTDQTITCAECRRAWLEQTESDDSGTSNAVWIQVRVRKPHPRASARKIASRSRRAAPPPVLWVKVRVLDAVRAISLEAMNFIGCSPVDQVLRLSGGPELTNKDARILDSGLYNGCTVDGTLAAVELDSTEDEEADDTKAVDAFTADGGPKRKRARAAGFRGILAGGSGASSSSSSSPITTTVSEPPKPIAAADSAVSTPVPVHIPKPDHTMDVDPSPVTAAVKPPPSTRPMPVRRPKKRPPAAVGGGGARAVPVMGERVPLPMTEYVVPTPTDSRPAAGAPTSAHSNGDVVGMGTTAAEDPSAAAFPHADIVWRCTNCTFDNKATNEACEMCEM
ncbi:hypothetical protein BC828DRAFT_418642 [Blastocladiella britannica]|nr:hypothetical protein BC828DRAFT_418642 [Blastocladiella britannica]